MTLLEEKRLKAYMDKHPNEWVWYSSLGDLQHIYTDVLIDESQGYVKEGHELCLWFRNGYNPMRDRFVPMTIGECPALPFNVRLRIPNQQLLEIRMFAYQNRDVLKEIADEKVRFDEDLFYNPLKDRIVEGISLLSEMANLLPAETGLLRRVWVDLNQAYLMTKHANRVKMFRKDKPDNTISIGLDDNITVYNAVPKQEQHAVDVVRKWIGYNLPLLRLASDQKMSEKDFLVKMIPFDGHGNPIIPTPQDKLIKRHDLGNGFSIVASPQKGDFNIASNDDLQTTLCPVWFSSWHGPVRRNGKSYLSIYNESLMYVFCFDDVTCTIVDFDH